MTLPATDTLKSDETYCWVCKSSPCRVTSGNACCHANVRRGERCDHHKTFVSWTGQQEENSTESSEEDIAARAAELNAQERERALGNPLAWKDVRRSGELRGPRGPRAH